MCSLPALNEELVISRVIEVLKEKHPRPMKTKEMAKFICCDELPVHKADLNRILDRYIKSGGTGLYRDEDGYWSLVAESAISSGSVSYEELMAR
jgi:hypothetical protein